MSEDSETKSAYTRALEWAEDIRTRPLDDAAATELAKVYAALASVEAYERAARALEALREPVTALAAHFETQGAQLDPPDVSKPTSRAKKPAPAKEQP